MDWVKQSNGTYTNKVNEEASKQLANKYERGIQLFTKYFLNLWD
jgi:hypothetical protein